MVDADFAFYPLRRFNNVVRDFIHKINPAQRGLFYKKGFKG